MGNKTFQKTSEDAEAVFYECFMHCDTEVMAALWADEDVICVHPGSGLILGHDAVVRSWASILNNAQTPELEYKLVQKTFSSDLAVHMVVEEMLNRGQVAAIILATNVYKKFPNGWLMVEHHASIIQNQSHGQTLQ